MVDADGTFSTEEGKTALRQGIYPLALYESPITIHGSLRGTVERVDQHMYSPRAAVSIAHKRQGDVAIEETLFLARPLDVIEARDPTESLVKVRTSIFVTQVVVNL